MGSQFYFLSFSASAHPTYLYISFFSLFSLFSLFPVCISHNEIHWCTEGKNVSEITICEQDDD